MESTPLNLALLAPPLDEATKVAYTAKTIMDLSAATTVDSGAYTGVADSRGRLIPVNSAEDDRLRAQVQNRQSQLQTSGNEATSAWNDPNNFEDGSRGVNDQFAGQAHRAQYQSVSGPIRPGAGSAPRSGPTIVNQDAESSGPRPRGYSPRDHGTVRFQNDQRVDQPVPARNERAPAPSPSSDSSRTLSAGPGSDSSRTLSAGSVAFAGVNETARSKPSRRGKRAGKQGKQKQASRPHVPSQAELDQPKINAILAAATADEANFLTIMELRNTDGPTIAKNKAQVVDWAIRSSVPSKLITQLGPEWVEIFQQTRKSLLAHAVNLLNMPSEEQQATYSRTANGVFLEFGKLCTEVENAMTAAASKFYSPVTEREWADSGKLDILLKAAEHVKPATGMAQVMDVDTAIEQTVEHIDLASSAPESLGITTTVSGPGAQPAPVPAQPDQGKIFLRIQQGRSDEVYELEGSSLPLHMSTTLQVSLSGYYSPSTAAYRAALTSVREILSEDYRLFAEDDSEDGEL